MTEVIQNIRYDKAEEALYILDQSLLPNEEKIIALRTAEEHLNLPRQDTD